MSLPNELHPLQLAASSGGGYEIEQSLRFNSADSAYLSRTPSSAGNRKTWTWSGWIKSNSVNTQRIFQTGTTLGTGNYFGLSWQNSGQLFLEDAGGFQLYTTALHRDPSAWYHIVVAVDTTQATSTNRIKLYVNGVQRTSFSTESYPGQNTNTSMNNNVLHYIGAEAYSGPRRYLDGYLAEINLIDGSALDPTDFGEFDNNGVWRPIQYAGSYTGNSFYLKFASGDGTDSSGLSNTWTANNFTVNPDSYVLATKTSGTFSTGTLRDVFDTNSGAAGGVYQEATTGSTAASTIDIEFSSALSGTITVTATDGTGGTNNGGQYQLIDSTDTVQVTQARPTNETTFTHTGLSDITKLRMYGGSSGLGGILISRFESSDQTIRTADWLGEGDVMSDTPTTNWCTLNPLDSGEFGGGITLSEGNLKAVSTSSDRHVRSTFFLPTSGKWYWEMTATTVNTAGYLAAGLYHATGSLTSTAVATAQGRWYAANGYGNGGSWGATYDDGDIIGIAVDMDSGKIWAAKNNTWQASGDPAAGTNPMYDDLLTAYSDIAWSPVCANWQSGNTADFNFGQRAFAYTPPTGFSALNTSNLPAPDIADGSKYFNTVLYTGNGTTNHAITGVGFQPDFVWGKRRDGAYSHGLFDSIRGGDKRLISNLTNAEDTLSEYLKSFDADGFTLGNDANLNLNTASMVAWNWLAGGSGSSNTDGSITSTVSANPTAGFSIVEFGTTGSTETYGHGLGVTPDVVLVKRTDNTGNWFWTYRDSSGAHKYLMLNSGNATTDLGYAVPTSTVFSWNNDNGGTSIAYCFAEVEGYSKFGIYTGNGNADGPFIYCGFKPAWIMIKNSTTAQGWYISDNKRDTYNLTYRALFASSADAESNSTGGAAYDFLSNGFKPRTSNNDSNGSGDTYVFAAFAENPFGGDGVSPATAR